MYSLSMNILPHARSASSRLRRLKFAIAHHVALGTSKLSPSQPSIAQSGARHDSRQFIENEKGDSHHRLNRMGNASLVSRCWLKIFLPFYQMTWDRHFVI